ncbi:vasopressin V2 receptor [Erpetoichthys calabaricus]|uniref:Vasopressin V2 receptor n=1 Tax=Erpetoichthys calabaricus TaxID=27687 RepID=A0A8C4SE94_ERPCA|nr:vasopressin V2 receptor [Erpetoichthys calabaricus]XP_028669243.1 vasopressin V2 receptor [Erpetoichthys calabaricus]XP_051789605.1 vasopressin V2 receptor [Erpetoichthys calabaricus]
MGNHSWLKSDLHHSISGSYISGSSASSFPNQNSNFSDMYVYSNSTPQMPSLTPSALPKQRDKDLAKAEIAILAAIMALAAVGNTFVLVILVRRRKHNAPMHVFMVNLCIADLVVAFFQVLPQLLWDITEHFMGPDILCRTIKYLQIVGMFASSYMIVAMTFDRHQAICHPMWTFQKRGARWNIPITMAWSLSLLLSLPQIFIFSKTKKDSGQMDCWGHFVEPWGLKAYITWMTVMVFIGPTIIIAVCQIRIFKEIHENIYLKSERVSAEIKKNKLTIEMEKNPSGVSKAMSKTIKMTLVIVLVYIICWAPFFIIQLWAAWDPNAPSQSIPFTIIMLLASLNSCTNPWIYTAFSSSVSKELIRLLCCRQWARRKNSIPDDSSTTGTSTTAKDTIY